MVIRSRTVWKAGRRCRTIVIIGAGFSGTAIAVRLLRQPPAGTCRLILIERNARFGPGLAYAGQFPSALLNVPAGRMSLDEHNPSDFVDYLRSRGCLVAPHDFVRRDLYGDYLETRLRAAARTFPTRIELVQMNGLAQSITRVTDEDAWSVDLEDGRAVLADEVVLALGHFAPCSPDALRPVMASGLYCADPWSTFEPVAAPRRVLLVGTGLTMADVACHLMRQPVAPQEILAVSRRGLLPQTRPDEVPSEKNFAVELGALAHRTTSVREWLSTTRDLAAAVGEWDGDWRDVIAALRDRAPDLWHRLGHRERARFLRHVQPYWDIHRHQLPPAIGKALASWIEQKRLRTRAARIVSAHTEQGSVVVDFRARGATDIERYTADYVVNCTGPEYHPRSVQSPLVGSLLRAGYLTADSTGSGLQVDARGQLIGRHQKVSRGLYYLGPWLRARDFEATAVPELRRLASSLAQELRSHSHKVETHVPQRIEADDPANLSVRRVRRQAQAGATPSNRSSTSSAE